VASFSKELTTNIFEQPWLLLIIAGALFLGVFAFRGLLPQRRMWLFWLLPVIIAVGGLALDFFVKTDTEKVKKVIAKAVKAVEMENTDALEPLISSNYRDSLHITREFLLNHCRWRLAEPIIEKNIHRVVSLEIKPPKASAVFTVRVVFDPQGPVYEYRKIMPFKLRADFEKQDREWFFSRVEILEIDLQPADWRRIQAISSEILG
jgi:hypothetical protein